MVIWDLLVDSTAKYPIRTTLSDIYSSYGPCNVASLCSFFLSQNHLFSPGIRENSVILLDIAINLSLKLDFLD